MKLSVCIIKVIAVLFSLVPSVGLAAEFSDLWKENGVDWNARSRLPDFSFAGYKSGEEAIPDLKQVASIKDFGAVGDGAADDTKAFLKAIEEVKSGAVFVPEGRYKITGILKINKQNFVLRGAGEGKTVLFFPVPLNDIKPNWSATTGGKRTSGYSWGGGFVWFGGGHDYTKLATVSSPALRGDTELNVSSSEKLETGQMISINLKDDAKKSLLNHLYSGDTGDIANIKPGTHRTRQICKIIGIKGNTITLDRPLRFDVRLEWNPVLHPFSPFTRNCGVENLAMEFPQREYMGHFSELGFNAIAFGAAIDCWARNIKIINADSGIFFGGYFCTAENIVFDAPGIKPYKGYLRGHHGVYLTGNDNLFTKFTFNEQFFHDISFSHGSGNVVSDGRGEDICFDHHKRAPYENLITNIDIGKGKRMWTCGGGAKLGKNSGARETFWNIRAVVDQKYPEWFGPPSMNLVGVKTNAASIKEHNGVWFENIEPEKLEPKNLHKAQLAKRLKSK